jgi:hypothetical protein
MNISILPEVGAKNKNEPKHEQEQEHRKGHRWT